MTLWRFVDCGVVGLPWMFACSRDIIQSPG